MKRTQGRTGSATDQRKIENAYRTSEGFHHEISGYFILLLCEHYKPDET